MKVYENPWVSRPMFFVPTGSAGRSKMAPQTRGWIVTQWEGQWKAGQGCFYTKDLKNEFPIVAENNENITRIVHDAVVDAVLAAVGGGEDDG